MCVCVRNLWETPSYSTATPPATGKLSDISARMGDDQFQITQWLAKSKKKKQKKKSKLDLVVAGGGHFSKLPFRMMVAGVVQGDHARLSWTGSGRAGNKGPERDNGH